MKIEILALTAILGLLAFLASCASRPSRPLPTVSQVDLSKYAGKWYEIARLPNAFQRDDSNATAEYTPQKDGSVKVLNTEFRPNGAKKVAEGSATAVPGSNNARLRVKFKGLAALAPSPKEGNYWIIRLQPDYSMVMVGTPDRKYLWILSRQNNPPSALLDQYTKAARDLGFDTSKLRCAVWSPAPPVRRPHARVTSS